MWLKIPCFHMSEEDENVQIRVCHVVTSHKYCACGSSLLPILPFGLVFKFDLTKFIKTAVYSFLADLYSVFS